MTLKIDPRLVEEIVRFAVHDPEAEGDVLVQIVQRFPDADDDNFSGAVNHMLTVLRELARQDRIEAMLATAPPVPDYATGSRRRAKRTRAR